MLRGIINGICRAAGGLRQIANTGTAVIHKMPIAFLHTAPKIVLRGVSHLICAALDLFVSGDIRLRPAPSLIKAGQHKNQPDLWITLPQAEDSLRCQSIKSQGTTCAEIAIALLNQLDQGVLQVLGDFGQIICRQFPMSGEANCFYAHKLRLPLEYYKCQNSGDNIYSIYPDPLNINSLWIGQSDIYRLYMEAMGMSDIAKIIGQRIRNYRTQKGLSQEKLAELAGCHPTYIGQLERGEKNATLESVEKIASAMDISLSELFDKLGKSGSNNIAAKCYDLVASKNEAEQKQLYKMLQEMDKYKNQ